MMRTLALAATLAAFIALPAIADELKAPTETNTTSSAQSSLAMMFA